MRVWRERYRRCVECGREVGYYGPGNHAEGCSIMPADKEWECKGKKPIRRRNTQTRGCPVSGG